MPKLNSESDEFGDLIVRVNVQHPKMELSKSTKHELVKLFGALGKVPDSVTLAKMMTIDEYKEEAKENSKKHSHKHKNTHADTSSDDSDSDDNENHPRMRMTQQECKVQ
jgi:DnaJ-class molecular chaperone